MTDRELLELAAKAAGANYNPTAKIKYGLVCADENGYLYTWNPLTDDGDALRLAVGLKIEIVISDQSATAIVDMIGYSEPLGADPYAATRRAITRAAAEIGKQK